MYIFTIYIRFQVIGNNESNGMGIIPNYMHYVQVLIKWLNLYISVGLRVWDKWWFNMVSEQKS
jgi:hypothetical protein